MWLVIKTQTGIQGEAKNPAHVEVVAYEDKDDAIAALRKEYVKVVEMLCDFNELEYSEFDADACECRIFGELAVVVIAVYEIKNIKTASEASAERSE